MGNRYQIGDFKKYLKLSPATLRFYEKKGLLQVPVDEKTSYRQYSYQHFGRLIHLRTLRFMGFSVDELKTLLEPNDVELFSQTLSAKEAENKEAIKQLRLANKAITLRKNALNTYIKKRGTWEIVDTPHFTFFSHIENTPEGEDSVASSIEDVAHQDFWTETYELGQIGIWMKSERPQSGSISKYIWGVASFEKDPSDFPYTEEVTKLSGGKALAVYLDWYFKVDELSKLGTAVEQACKESGVLFAGEAYFLLEHVTYEEDVALHTGVIFVPLQPENCG